MLCECIFFFFCSFEKVLTWKKHRFACHDPWRQVHYGSHPRHLIVTDRTAVEIFDHRVSFFKYSI